MRLFTALFAAPLAAVTLVLSSPAAMAEDAYTALPYVQVAASGNVKAHPDYLSLSLSISATEKSLSRAKTEVDKGFRHALAAAKSLKIQEEDIDSAHIRNYPQYRWNSGTRHYEGEQVTRDMTITLRDMDQYGELVHKLMQNDRIQVQNSQFKFSNRTALEHQALRKALLAAKQKATLMASTMDMTLGKVLVMTEGSSHMPQPRYQMEAMAMADASRAKAAPMLVQEQTISSQVDVRFQLK